MSTDVVPTDGPFTEKGLVLSAGTTFEQWEQQGYVLGRIYSSLPFWIGDWRVFGEAAFGNRNYQVELPIRRETELTYTWVAQRIPINDRRIPELSFSHHRLVAALPRSKRNTWLEKAVKERWTTRDFRAALLVKKLDVGAEAVSPDPSPAVAAPSYTVREALVTIGADAHWRHAALSALEQLDTLICPHCGGELEL